MSVTFRLCHAPVVLLIALLSATATAKPVWKPVTPEELAETTPKVGRTAPAEIVFLQIEVDDRDFPMERKTTTYVRYKVFEPEKSDQITRITDIKFTASQDRTELYARLTLRDGRVQEFGKESIKERPLIQQAKQAGFLGWLAGSEPLAKERFLAITGVERGAVLEYHTTQYDRFPPHAAVIIGQRENFPVRWFEYKARTKSDDTFFNRTFVTKARGAQISQDPKTKVVTVTASNLPEIALEPYGGAVTDQVFTVLSCYEQARIFLLPRTGKVPMPGTVDAKAGPWAPYATLMEWAARDRGVPTKRSAALAAEITQPAKSEEEKAALIHRWTQKEWQGFRTLSAKKPTPRTSAPNSLDDVIAWEKNPDLILTAEDFMWLALSLYRTAGLAAHAVLLPNREFTRFNRNWASPVFLPHQAIAISINGTWRFSSPHNAYSLPFDMLPWQQEGQLGLLALERKQEFIDIPVSPPERSSVVTQAKLELESDGTIHGKFLRRVTGQLAAPLREELRATAESDRRELMKKKLGLDLKAAELTILQIDGLDDPEKPLEIGCELRWPNYAVRTKDRLIFRPMVFRADGVTPFSAEERKNPVFFPHRWQETDQITLHLPEGYDLEAPTAPTPVDNSTLRLRVTMAVDSSTQTLRAERAFMSNVVVVVDQYPLIRKFYDHVVRSDQHELVLRKRSAATSQ